MKIGEKLALGVLVIGIFTIIGATIGFLYYVDFGQNLEFHIKLIYLLIELLAIVVAILYIFKFTGEKDDTAF